MSNHDPLTPEALATFSTGELEALRALFHDAVRRKRQKVEVATIGFVAAQATLSNIDAALASKQQPEPDNAA